MKSKKYDLNKVFSDLDGTPLQDDHLVLRAQRDVIKDVKKSDEYKKLRKDGEEEPIRAIVQDAIDRAEINHSLTLGVVCARSLVAQPKSEEGEDQEYWAGEEMVIRTELAAHIMEFRDHPVELTREQVDKVKSSIHTTYKDSALIVGQSWLWLEEPVEEKGKPDAQ